MLIIAVSFNPQFHGSGSMLQCQGTSKEEAQQNQLLRETVASDESVKSTFGTFYLENGQEKVTLDVLKAFVHVRHVLNDIRRAHAGKDASKENDNPMVCIIKLSICKSNT